MKSMPFFLWTLWACPEVPPVIEKQHIVIQSPTAMTDPRTMMAQAFPIGVDMHSTLRRIVYFTDDPSPRLLEGVTTIPMRSVFRSRPEGTPRPRPRSHGLMFLRSRYADVMDYNDFCSMEEQMASLLDCYLGDRKRHWAVLIDDPLMAASMRDHGTKETMVDQTAWVSSGARTTYADYMLTDLDSGHGDA